MSPEPVSPEPVLPDPLRLAFLGTPDFARTALEALLGAGHTVAAVYCQPPRPAGRGHKEQHTPVHAFAAARGLEVRTPRTLRTPEEQAAFAALDLDAAVVAAYGLILPPAILNAPRLGCFNIHASLLPRWRGAAPIHRALLAGDQETGVTIMRMDAGLDTGPMLAACRTPITQAATAQSLHDTLAVDGARLMVSTLAAIAAGTAVQTPQPAEGVTYAAKLQREEGRIVWEQPAETIARQVRALTPWPGVWFEHGGERIKVLTAVPVTPALPSVPGTDTAAPGTLLAADLTIACGTGMIRLERVQRAGKAPCDGAAFLRGFAAWKPGEPASPASPPGEPASPGTGG